MQNEFLPAFQQLDILRRGAAEIIDESELLARLECSRATGVPLRIKLGVDPTAPDIHLGHTVVMRKLRQFQDLGHQVVLIVGDYTATVGDPSGRKGTRPRLSHAEVLEHARTYQEQFFRIVDRNHTEVVHNGDWFGSLTFAQTTALMARMTVAQMLEREDFALRYRQGVPISLHEFLYPLMQGLDSVMVRADVELGGTDQKFNVLCGRELQRDAELTALLDRPVQKPQVGFFLPILLGIDGREKMSKSLGNYVGIEEPPQVMYHKIYSIPDAQCAAWSLLLTDIPQPEITELVERLATHPQDANSWKARIACSIVAQYHGEAASTQAREREQAVHRGEILPDDTLSATVASGILVLDLLVQLRAVPSKAEGKKLIQNGGVSLDGVRLENLSETVAPGNHILKAGKRRFWRLQAN